MTVNLAHRIKDFRRSHYGIAIAIFFGVANAWSLPIWINEFHYDNASTDTGEFVEVAGLAGIDLSGYEILLYNGNGGALYDTINLSGIFDDEGAGFGALSFDAPGMQNGSPDALALFDGSAVLQFLSYEGSFIAVGGAADGLTSTDIGISEGSSTPAGASLQLVGTGNKHEDFTWSGPSTASPGSINNGQTFTPTSVPESLPSGFVAALFLAVLALPKIMRGLMPVT